MKSRALRFAVATLVVVALGGAAYVTWIEESAGTTTAAAARSFDARAQLVSRTLLEIKSAQSGYVAAGQDDDFWTRKVDVLLGSTRDGLAALRSLSQTSEAQPELETAVAAFEDFEQMDRRAREYARSGQRLLASDLVFSDGIEKMDAAAAALGRAREIELAASDSHLQLGRRNQLMAVAGAGAVSLLMLALLVPLPHEVGTAAAKPVRPTEPAADYPISLRVQPAVPEPAPVVAAPPPASVAAAPSVDLAEIASVCSDLARVVDTRALPSALERAARLLDASGIVVWVADPDGRELIPVVAHGYPHNLLIRLGTIDRDAENVTAAAFRTGLIQTVKSDASSPGAIAAPLLTPSGPVGVMAAEMLHEGERHEHTLSATAIVAAQLATLMAPPTQPAAKAEVRA